MTSNILHLPTRSACPAWCSRAHHDDAFHVSDFHGHQEHDDDGQTVFALGGRVMTLFDGHPPHVEVLMWASEDGTVTAQENHPITPAKARELAGVLLRLADDAEGVTR